MWAVADASHCCIITYFIRKQITPGCKMQGPTAWAYMKCHSRLDMTLHNCSIQSRLLEIRFDCEFLLGNWLEIDWLNLHGTSKKSQSMNQASSQDVLSPSLLILYLLVISYSPTMPADGHSWIISTAGKILPCSLKGEDYYSIRNQIYNTSPQLCVDRSF